MMFANTKSVKSEGKKARRVLVQCCEPVLQAIRRRISGCGSALVKAGFGHDGRRPG
jgi:uncharacterized protein YggT (Ycf19 family)